MATPAEQLTPASPAAIAAAREADEIHLDLARRDANAFMEYIMRDESTGNPVQQSPAHEEWHQLIDKHDRLLIWSHVEAGKTNNVTVGRTLFELGRKPNLRVCIVSNTHDQACKITRAVSKYIEQSAELRRVFPKLVPSTPWTTSQLFINRPNTSKDPSVQATGIHGNITGARIDLLIMDDMLDYENTLTPGQREEVYKWYQTTLVGRLTRDARVIVVGTAYHPEDFLHRLAAHPGWVAKRYPVIHPDTGRPYWPERWSMERIEKRKRELTPAEFARQMMCLARDDGEARFKKEWIDAACELGRAFEVVDRFIPTGGIRTYTGVDLGVQRHAKSDKSVFFTIAVHPDGRRQVLNIEAGRFTGPDIVQKIIDSHNRFGSICVVENNAAQDFILQFTRGVSAVPLVPYTTGRQKAHPEFGIESMAAEMKGGKWIIPSKEGLLHPEVREWITEMLFYSPEAHTGDRLMASWFAREGANLAKPAKKVQFGSIDFSSR